MASWDVPTHSASGFPPVQPQTWETFSIRGDVQMIIQITHVETGNDFYLRAPPEQHGNDCVIRCSLQRTCGSEIKAAAPCLCPDLVGKGGDKK